MSNQQDSCAIRGLDTLPTEILEQIAVECASTPVIGPPQSLFALVLTNRAIAFRISPSSNPLLYERIFKAKFDFSAVSRRLKATDLNPTAYFEELKLRFKALKTLRAQAANNSYDDKISLSQLLWTCYFMTLEDDGLNSRQLMDYGNLDIWLRAYLFTTDNPCNGFTCTDMSREKWFPESKENTLAFWLLCFYMSETLFSSMSQLLRQSISKKAVFEILKVGSLGAHKYPLSTPLWNTWKPSTPSGLKKVSFYGTTIQPSVLPLSVASIPTFIADYVLLSSDIENGTTAGLRADLRRLRQRPIGSAHYDSEWNRCLALGNGAGGWTGAYELGSMDGLWEGEYTFMDFGVFTHLLRGAPPSLLSEAPLGHQKQTWNLREYIITEDSGVEPLPMGAPLDAHLPSTAVLKEHAGDLLAQPAGSSKPIIYSRSKSRLALGMANNTPVKDIIILGDGDSAWGQFRLRGRVRLFDGFFCLLKDFDSEQRGQWLYRGYLVGGKDGKISGRWRDTTNPPHFSGYECAFVMGRQR